MNQHQELIIKALNEMEGGQAARTRTAFSHYTPQRMQEQHGASGKTRTEYLQGLEANESAVHAAIAWVEAQPE